MLTKKETTSLEEEIRNNKKEKDEDVEINIRSKRKRFDDFKIKYKKDKKKYLVTLSAIIVVLSMTIGSSYAYLTYVSQTDNTVVLDAGALALTFQNKQNVISIYNAVPMKDQVGLAQEDEYSFDVTNTGSIPALYTITLNNTCVSGQGLDLCVPDEYIKVGIKVGTSDYKVVERNDKDKYVIETGALSGGGSTSYKMKIWLSYDTPNTYNAQGNQSIAYKGQLGLTYEQGKVNFAKTISSTNYSVTNYQNRTTSELKTDGAYDGYTNQPYFRISAASASNVDTSWKITSSSPISVIGGNQYILSFYVRSENALITQYMNAADSNYDMTKIIWSTGAETKLSEIKNFENDGEWHYIFQGVVAPSGATTATIVIGNDTPNLCGSGAYIDIANIKFLDK